MAVMGHLLATPAANDVLAVESCAACQYDLIMNQVSTHYGRRNSGTAADQSAGTPVAGKKYELT